MCFSIFENRQKKLCQRVEFHNENLQTFSAESYYFEDQPNKKDPRFVFTSYLKETQVENPRSVDFIIWVTVISKDPEAQKWIPGGIEAGGGFCLVKSLWLFKKL